MEAEWAFLAAWRDLAIVFRWTVALPTACGPTCMIDIASLEVDTSLIIISLVLTSSMSLASCGWPYNRSLGIYVENLWPHQWNWHNWTVSMTEVYCKLSFAAVKCYIIAVAAHSCWVVDVCCRRVLDQWRLHMCRCLHVYPVQLTQAVEEVWLEPGGGVVVAKTVATLASLARQFALCKDRTKVLSSILLICTFVGKTTLDPFLCATAYIL